MITLLREYEFHAINRLFESYARLDLIVYCSSCHC